MPKEKLKKIKKVLIANRGEIAVRIIRACRELGIEAVAIYSEADSRAMHVQLADEAYCVGPAPATESYLRGDRIIEIAKEAGCHAIHPGYGFLAENADFAAQVAKRDLIYIGPPASAMRLMGDKISARNTAQAQGVPTTPGVFDPIDSLGEAKECAKSIGYPVLIKAAAGGGGKGMRLVEDEADLEDGFERAVSEVEKSFGDPAVFIEKFIRNAKHIEVQVMADSHGNCVHLFERECSVQRRYQKVIEETPAPLLTDQQRLEMGESAVSIAKACNYQSAGTVEFIYDVDEEEYYFLEMNTRIQVEHPITEMTTGRDLVREQLLIAMGQPLSFSQDEIEPRGAAIECRIYAEDPAADFAPSTGVIKELLLPSGAGIRIDSGVRAGDEVSRYYDPMLMKLVVWDSDRANAIERMKSALRELYVIGVATPIRFHIDALSESSFVDGSYTTSFAKYFEQPDPSDQELEAVAIAVALAHHEHENGVHTASQSELRDQELGWRWTR